MTDPAAVEMLDYLSKFEMGHINLITKWIKEI